MVHLRIRDFTNSDYSGVFRVFNSVWPDYSTSVEDLKHEDDVIVGNGYFLKRFVAVSPDERIVAYGDISERAERYQPGKLHVSIEVDRQFRPSSMFHVLFERLKGIAIERKASLLTARGSTKDRFTTSRLREKGFRVASRDIESRLDLRKLDQRSIEESIARIVEGEIAYTTLGAEKRLNPNLVRELYRMENEAGQDVPATDRWRRMEFSEYVDLVHKSPRVIDDGWLIAKRGKRYVGESFLMKGEGYPKFLTTGFTCVLREFRRRSVAESLKLRALLWAKKHNVEFVMTWNDSQNAPILGLNRKLGFKRFAIWFKFEKRLRR
jgi:GNAT superfamily N-acetyltransferase